MVPGSRPAAARETRIFLKETMHQSSTGWSIDSGRFAAVRTWGAIALMCAACSSSDEPEPSPTSTPGSTQASSSSAPQSPVTANPGTPAADPTTPAAAEPGKPVSNPSEGPPEVSALEPSPAAEEAGSGQDAGAPEPTDPTLDENLSFILEDGFETTYFAVHCSAIGDDGSVIDGDTVQELPVGGGYTLECNIDSLPSRATTDVLSAADEPWCALGELQTFRTDGDERLDIVLSSPPDSPSPTLIATSAEPITLQLASAFGAALWPVWLVTNYDAVEVARAEQGKLCDEVFGL
jgi:hypothetical protein